MKVFWEAIFNNGSICLDPDLDISELDQTKSRFFDVLERAKKDKLIAFYLYKNFNAYSVNLVSGTFHIGDHQDVRYFRGKRPLESFGIETSVQPEKLESPYELIYFKDVTQTLTLGKGTFESIRYRIGFRSGTKVRVIVI